MVDVVETTGTTTDSSPAPAVDAPVDPLATPTLLGAAADPPAADPAKPEGGDPKPADAEKPADEAKPVGAPEVYELKAPEGVTLDTDAVKLAEPVFKELNLSNEQAQKLTDLYPKLIERVQQAGASQMSGEIAAVRADWAKAAQSDPEIGGAKLDETKALAAKAMDGLKVPDTFRAFLNETGLGNHPEMIRMLRRVGSAISEDGFARGTGAAAKPTTAEVLYPNDAKRA